MNQDQIERLRIIFRAMQQGIQEDTVKHGITLPELMAFSGWVKALVAADQVEITLLLLLGIPAMTASTGHEYAEPWRDGATPWVVEGPAHVVGAPAIPNPGSLPMRPDEGGEALFVSGVVKSTLGEPVAGAVIDIWQNDANGRYSSLTLEAAGPVPGIVDLKAPAYNLRGKITTDGQGYYAFRTVTPGPEQVSPPGSFCARTLELLDIVNSRPKHIHSIVTADGFNDLTHQIYFYGDPMTLKAPEGRLDPSSMYRAVARKGPVPFGPETADGAYYTVACDYTLRPVGTA